MLLPDLTLAIFKNYISYSCHAGLNYHVKNDSHTSWLEPSFQLSPIRNRNPLKRPTITSKLESFFRSDFIGDVDVFDMLACRGALLSCPCSDYTYGFIIHFYQSVSSSIVSCCFFCHFSPDVFFSFLSLFRQRNTG